MRLPCVLRRNRGWLQRASLLVLSERLAGPAMPVTEERPEHGKHHCRSRCRYCARGKGTQATHRQQQEAPTVPEFHVDFVCTGDEGASEKMAVLVVEERTCHGRIMSQRSSISWIASGGADAAVSGGRHRVVAEEEGRRSALKRTSNGAACRSLGLRKSIGGRRRHPAITS